MNKIVVVRRPTRLDSLVAKFNTRRQAQFYIEHLGASFDDYEKEHDRYYAVLESLQIAAARLARIQDLEWKYLPNFLFGAEDLVVTVGQDGLIANTLKYLSSQVVIGINPDPGRWDGVLSQFSVEEAPAALETVLGGRAELREVTKARIRLSDGQTLLAVNDFFIGVKNHSSARYAITVDGQTEVQSSSGVIVSTPLGRSGWMKSVISGATGIFGKIAGRASKVEEVERERWDRDRLFFAVREPFPSVSTGNRLVFGAIRPDTEFKVESRMGENGLIFSDGIQEDFLDFNYSVVASVGLAETKGRIAVKHRA